MAESQLMCMEDGHIGARIPESNPEFYYSEEQRAAVEELLKNGDGAYKTRLKDDNITDFLSAREVKLLVNTFKHYDMCHESSGGGQTSACRSEGQQEASRPEGDSGVHSTYWPQMSDTEVPQLEIGWPGGGLFKGVTRVTVHTHPPKDNGPHIKEVVRRLIQGASKVIAILMDMLTDVHILQDLMDAASRRSVPVYILLDSQGVPHFLDMCSRLQIGAQHLRNIRARTLQGIGLGLSFGKLPGSLCNKYMLVDGDKVVFGSYSFTWSTARMDRNMITVTTGQVVDFYDRDFRELYAISEKLDLYREFHLSSPTTNSTATLRSKAAPKRPPLPATTSRFQVSLGDSRNPEIQVPAHKFYNPKYELAFGNVPRPTGSLHELGAKQDTILAEVSKEGNNGRPRVASSEKMDWMSPLPSEAPSEIFKRHNGTAPKKKSLESHFPWKKKSSAGKSSWSHSSKSKSQTSSPTETHPAEETEDATKGSKKSSKVDKRTKSQTANSAHEHQSESPQRDKKRGCNVS
ncbi:protein FAM83F [Nothobranchius furzeri]|uniref:Protein FAM83F-like n=2 Tax=Nothobranchius TaxID=28779 RepID=A0A8C6K6V7_NOTFU|nr:protein FAM83F [Nothobranchius furzeri]KAF7203532.1 protein FAM83F-like [Nothobranchius furzeri]